MHFLPYNKSGIESFLLMHGIVIVENDLSKSDNYQLIKAVLQKVELKFVYNDRRP